MNEFYILEDGTILGDMNTYRIWKRYESQEKLWDVDKGIFNRTDPHKIWSLNHWDQQPYRRSVPEGYARMTRVSLAEFESLVLQFLLDDLDQLEQKND